MDIEADKGEAMVFAASLVQQVNREDVANMVNVQRGMLQRFEKTNEMLINFNQLSFARYEASVSDFQQHTHLLYDMKKDLDSIFKRIRVLKQRLGKSYPDAFAACSTIITVEDEEEEEEPVSTTTTATTTTTNTTTTTSQSSTRSTATPRPASHPTSRGAADADGCTSHQRIAQPQRPRSKSATVKSGEEGATKRHARKTSRSKTVGGPAGGVESQGSHPTPSSSSTSSSSLASQSQPKPM